MRLTIGQAGGEEFLGVCVDNHILDLDAAGEMSAEKGASYLRPFHPFDDWGGLITAAKRTVARFESGEKHADWVYAESDVKVVGPAPLPRQIIGAARNYKSFLDKAGQEPPPRPAIFAKWPSTICGPGVDILIPAGIEVTYEAEVAAVIGRPTYRISPEEALEHVAGYTVFNDFTAVNLIRLEKNLQRAKNLSTFAAFGPYLDVDLWDGNRPLAVKLRVNGEERQSSTTDDMVYSTAELISYLSYISELWPGDVIATGSPGGVAQQWDPPCYLQDGDVVEAEVEGLGILENRVRRIAPLEI